MDELAAALERSPTIDFTTIGSRSGRPARIEIWAWIIEGRCIITGTPGPRDWFANIRANPEVVVHAGERDFFGTAVVVDDEAFRRRVFTDERTTWYLTQTGLEDLVANAPMVEIVFGR